jgi:hypothetical protein
MENKKTKKSKHGKKIGEKILILLILKFLKIKKN